MMKLKKLVKLLSPFSEQLLEFFLLVYAISFYDIQRKTSPSLTVEQTKKFYTLNCVTYSKAFINIYLTI